MDVMGEHIRFLELRRAECDHRPQLHPHQIAAYDELLAAARAAESHDAYLTSSSNILALARAEWMDRYRFFAKIAAALGDERKERAALLNYEAAETATSHSELTEKVSDAKRRAAPLRHACDVAAGNVSSLVTWLIEWATEGYERARADKRDIVRGYWNALTAADPGCTWQRICEHPPYRNRLPFGDAQLGTVGSWLSEVLDGAPPAEPAGETTFPTAGGSDIGGAEWTTVEEAARAFHVAYDALPSADPVFADARTVYERVFEVERAADSTHAFYRELAERNLFCELARAPWQGLVRAQREHCEGLSQPHLEAHYAELVAALDACTSPTEVEFEVERASEMLSVETAWNDILLTAALKPLRAALAYEFDASDAQRDSVRASCRVAEQLFGLSAEALLDTPRIREFVAEVLFTRGQRIVPELVGPGVFLGEVGLLAVQDVRDAAMHHVMGEIQRSGLTTPLAIQDRMKELSNEARFATVADMRAHVLRLWASAVDYGAGAPANGVPVVLWGTPVPVLGLAATLRNPPRPAIDLS